MSYLTHTHQMLLVTYPTMPLTQLDGRPPPVGLQATSKTNNMQHSQKYRGQPPDQCPCTVDYRRIYSKTSIRMYFNHMGMVEDDFLSTTHTLRVCHLLFPIHLALLACERVSSTSAVLHLLLKTSSTVSTRTPRHSSPLCPDY